MADSDQEFIDVITVDNVDEYQENAACLLKRLSHDINTSDSGISSHLSSDQSMLLISDVVNVLDLTTKLQTARVVLRKLTTIEILKYTKKPTANFNTTKKQLKNVECDYKNSSTKLHDDGIVDNNLKSISCGLCHKSFKKIFQLQKHMYYCGKEPEFFCQFCSYETQFKSALKDHLRRKHHINADVSVSSKMLETSDVATLHGTDKIGSNIKWHCSACNKTVNGDTSANIIDCLECNNKMNLQCTRCKEQFGNRERAIHHSKFACLQKQIRCSECLYVNSSLSLFYSHMNSKHPFKPLKPVCGKCLNQFESIKGLKLHWERCAINSNFFCHHCDFHSKTKRTLIYHMKKHVINYDDHECMPGKRFEKALSLKRHALNCMKVTDMQCAHCSFRTKNRRYLIKHLRLAHFSYDSDKKINQHRTNLTEFCMRHCVICNESVPYEQFGNTRCYRCNVKYLLWCTKCNLTIKNYKSIWHHFYQIHVIDPNDGLLKCPNCGSAFRFARNFHNHFKFCGKEPDLCCDICSYKTKYKKSLKKHKQSHASGRNLNKLHNVFRPRVISKQQKNVPYDRRYVKVHCPQCSRVRIVASCYSDRMVCQKCKCDLEFRCYTCNAKMPTREALVVHWKEKHSLNDCGTCANCGKIFALIKNLRMHEKVCRTDNNVQGS